VNGHCPAPYLAEYQELYDKYGLCSEETFTKGYLELQKAAYLSRSPMECILMGEFYYIHEVYATAIFLWEIVRDHSIARRLLGNAYLDGRGVVKDTKKGIALLESATAQGDHTAAFVLGTCYRNGNEVDKDDVKALALFQSGAEAGHLSCKYAVGVMMVFGGIGVEKNEEKGIATLQELCNQGHAESALRLSHLYNGGVGVEKDLQKSLEYAKLAFNLGNHEAAFFIGLRYYIGTGPEGKRDCQQAKEFFEQAAAKGNVQAHEFLGRLYFHGDGVAKDFEMAAYYNGVAAQKGDQIAQLNLGIQYSTGEGVPKDQMKAIFWYQQSVAQGYYLAQYYLGLAYLRGEGVMKDPGRAVHLLEQAAIHDKDTCIRVMNKLGSMFLDGTDGLSKDVRRACGYFQKAADQGSSFAQNSLGMIYWKSGQPAIPKDTKKAVHYFNLAASRGYAAAQSNLGRLYVFELRLFREAAELFQEAHLQNYPETWFHLYQMYERGLGVPLDVAKAAAYKKRH